MRASTLLLVLVALVLVAAVSDGQRFTMITNNTVPDQYPRVSEDGGVCTWVGGSDAWVWDGGPAPRQLTSVGNIPIPYYLTISGDGRTVGFVSNRSVWTVPVSGGAPTLSYQANSPDSTQGPLTLSYDGSLICFTKYDGTTKSSDQWVAKTDGSSALNVTNRQGTSYHDREGWMSADGKSVVYTALVGGARNVWIVNADGTNARPLTTFTTAGNIRFPVIDRFGKNIAYGYEATSSIYQIYTVPSAGGTSILVSKPGADSWMPYLSELDGDKVSFKTQELGSSQEEVFIAWIDGSNRRQVTNFQGGITRLTNSSHALNGDGTIGVYVTDQDYQSQNPTRDREIILWHDALSRSGPVSPGATVNLLLDVPSRPNEIYLVRCSFNRQPGFPLPGAGTVPLNPDALFFLSGAVPSIFQNFAGTLDGNGVATAAIAVPNSAALRGLRFYAAFVAVGTSGIFISDSLSLTVL
jgi:Tol biopolymer transport system component